MYQKKLPARAFYPPVDPTQLIQEDPTHITLSTPEFDVVLPVQFTTEQLPSSTQQSAQTPHLVFEFDSKDNLRAIIDPISHFRYFDSRKPILQEPSTWSNF